MPGGQNLLSPAWRKSAEARFLARALAAAADRAEGTIVAAQETALDV
jgi:hypothetical protein